MASIWKLTSTAVRPLGPAGSSRLNWPSNRLSAAIGRAPLVDLDRHGGLSILGRGERFLLRWVVVVFRSDQLVKNALALFSSPSESGLTSSRNTRLDVAGEDRSLNGGTDGDDLVGVDPWCGSLPKMSLTICWTVVRVAPPTRTTSSIPTTLSWRPQGPSRPVRVTVRRGDRSTSRTGCG